LLNLLRIIFVLIFVNVKTLIMLMLLLEQARGHHVGDPCCCLLNTVGLLYITKEGKLAHRHVLCGSF